MNYQPKHRLDTDNRTEYEKIIDMSRKYQIKKYKNWEAPYCQEVEDGIDGFVIHAPDCVDYQYTYRSGSKCINLTRVVYREGMK